MFMKLELWDMQVFAIMIMHSYILISLINFSSLMLYIDKVYQATVLKK